MRVCQCKTLKPLRLLSLALALLLTAGLAGCSPGALQFGDTSVKVDPGTGSVKVEDKQGTLSVSTAGQLPEGFPADLFPLPAGARVTSSLTGEAPNQAVGRTFVISAESPDSSDQLVEFYVSHLQDAQNYSKMDMNTSTNLIGSKGGYSFVINIYPEKEGCTVNISVTEEKSGQ